MNQPLKLAGLQVTAATDRTDVLHCTHSKKTNLTNVRAHATTIKGKNRSRYTRTKDAATEHPILDDNTEDEQLCQDDNTAPSDDRNVTCAFRMYSAGTAQAAQKKQ